MLAAWDGAKLFWVILFVHVLPMVFLLWATWFIWKSGRGAKTRGSQATPRAGDPAGDSADAPRLAEDGSPFTAERPAEARTTAPRASWDPGFCRECGYGTPVHSKTGLCESCHARPLPEKAEIPGHLPESL